MGDGDNSGGDACLGTGSMSGISVPSAQNYCEFKSALRKAHLKKEKEKEEKEKEKKKKKRTRRKGRGGRGVLMLKKFGNNKLQRMSS